MSWFTRFRTPFAIDGILDEPTDAQQNQGFSFLGPQPPTVEQFNGLFNNVDRRSGWLFDQINSVLVKASITASPTESDSLAAAISRISGGGSFIPTSTTLGPQHGGTIFASAAAGSIRLDLPPLSTLGGPLVYNINRFDSNANNTLQIARAAGANDGLDQQGVISANINLGGGLLLLGLPNSSVWYCYRTGRRSVNVWRTPGTASFTPQPGMHAVYVRMWAGGGGGGAPGGFNAGVAGGGGGEYREGELPVVPGAMIPLTVGSGGIAGKITGTNTETTGAAVTHGGNGADTVVGSWRAKGGIGTISMQTGIAANLGIGGSGGSGGQFSVPGGTGGTPMRVLLSSGDIRTDFVSTAWVPGSGGAAFYGAGPGVNTSFDALGRPVSPGAGGSGGIGRSPTSATGTVTQNGNPGADGLIIIEA